MRVGSGHPQCYWRSYMASQVCRGLYFYPQVCCFVVGVIEGDIKGKRGLRQGDPLSLVLFVMVMHVLFCILARSSTLGRLKFHPKCEAIRLNHLAFADDLIIWCNGDEKSIRSIKLALDNFAILSGLVPNRGKSLFLSAGVSVGNTEAFLSILGFEAEASDSLPWCSSCFFPVVR